MCPATHSLQKGIYFSRENEVTQTIDSYRELLCQHGIQEVSGRLWYCERSVDILGNFRFNELQRFWFASHLLIGDRAFLSSVLVMHNSKHMAKKAGKSLFSIIAVHQRFAKHLSCSCNSRCVEDLIPLVYATKHNIRVNRLLCSK